MANPLQYLCVKNPMDRGAQQAIVQRVAKSWTCLSAMHARTAVFWENFMILLNHADSPIIKWW